MIRQLLSAGKTQILWLFPLAAFSCGVSGAGTDGGTLPGARRVFATQTTYSGSLGGLSGADGRCANAATAAALGGTWKAWISVSGTNAIDRITDVGPWVLVGSNAIVFNNKAQLAGNPLVPIDRVETGAQVAGVKAWTGTSVGGTVSTDTCAGWTLATGPGGTYGDAERRWTDEGISNCANPASLYCFEQ